MLIDRGESIGLMEPLLISENSKYRTKVSDLALELAEKSSGFRHSLPEDFIDSNLNPSLLQISYSREFSFPIQYISAPESLNSLATSKAG